jgi:hypothetical protein
MHRSVHLIPGFIFILLGVGTLASTATTTRQAPTPAEVDQWIARYKATGEEYRKVFLNLVAEETKVIENFDSSGRVNKRREIVSDLLVHQSSRDSGGQTAEYRDVRSVDGEPVKNRDKRILDLIQRADKTDSIEKEIALINRESQRYDVGCTWINTTVYPSSFAFRDHFRFEWVGRDQIGGSEVVSIDFREVGPSIITLNSELKRMGLTAVFARGRLWLDATTSQLRQERAEIAGIHPGVSEPVTVMRLQRENINADDSLDILTPKRIVIDWFHPSKTQRNQPPAFGLLCRTTLTYGRFRRFGVTTQIAAPER